MYKDKKDMVACIIIIMALFFLIFILAMID